MKLTTNGVAYDTTTSVLLKEYVLRQWTPENRESTIGFARLYRDKATSAYWLHERMYGPGEKDIALPLSETEARAWLKDRFGQWRQFDRLEAQVFGATEGGAP